MSGQDRVPTIGVVMDFFQPAIVEGAGAYAREHGLRVDARWSVRADWMPRQPGWHGVLVSLVDMESAERRVEALQVPIVHLSGWLGEWARPRVDANYAACGALAVGEFRRLGLRRVAALGRGLHAVDWRSFRGVRVAARRGGLEFLRLRGWPDGLSWTDGVGFLADEVAALERPCGLFLPHAGATVTLLDELASRSVRVPDDVAIIVIDKDPQRTAELAPVPLTAVVPDDWQQGYEAAALVHRMIRGEPVEQRIWRVPPAGIVSRASTGVSASRDPVVAKALHLIGGRGARISGVGELAALVGVSRRTLETRFRRETGDTPHRALTRRRMDEAKRLLRASRCNVAEVAESCGYSSVHYFSTAFKRAVGQTPGGYRRSRNGPRAGRTGAADG